jgi:hypothetical protein
MTAARGKTGGKKPEAGKAATNAGAKKASPKPSENEEHWDEVAEASWESFPASDPPPWTASRPGNPAKKPGGHK